MTVVLALLIGVTAGVMSGMFGIGGGLVMLPGMVLLLGYSQKTANGTSLAALLLPVALLAVLAYHRAGHVDWQVAGLLAAGIAVGSYAGARIALGTSENVLRWAFAAVLVVAAVRLVTTTR